MLCGFIKPGFGFYIGQVRTGTRFGITLTPELLAADNARQVFLFLRFAAEGDDGGARQAFADVPYPTRATSAGIFFKKDHLLLDRTTTAAILLGPAHTGPAPFGHALFPGVAFMVKHVLITGAAPITNGFKFTLQVLLQPVGDFLTKLFVCGAETQFHSTPSPSNSNAAKRSRCQAPFPKNCSDALARLKYKCTSYSQVKPTPPWIWMASPAFLKNASEQ